MEPPSQLIEAAAVLRRELLGIAEQLRIAGAAVSLEEFVAWAREGLGLDLATAQELANFDGVLRTLSEEAVAYFGKLLDKLGAQMH